MSAPGNNSVVTTGSNDAVVELATNDYLACLGVDEYFHRCMKKRVKYFNQNTRDSIVRMKALAGSNEPNDLAEMAECMTRTFNLRFQDIMYHKLSVKNAVDIYPGLRDFQELRREFERVTGKSVHAFERHLNCVLKQYAKDQIGRKYYTCTSSYCRESLEIIRRDEKHHAARKTAARIIIYSCAQSQRTWWDVIFKVFGESENAIARPHPTVMVHGTPFAQNCADVYCEQIKILAGVNFYEAILSCYFLYYIFNLNYPEVDAETYQPFDNVMNLMASAKEKASLRNE